jgi:ribosomal protein S18 acetylase RimI-like enzyme
MNNPPAKCAYLCNMAVLPGQRRRGIARLLLQSAEELAGVAGEQEMYLHLRLIDQPAAQLYRRNGFMQRAEDNLLVQLLGQDRKYLMCKQLGRAAPQVTRY